MLATAPVEVRLLDGHPLDGGDHGVGGIGDHGGGAAGDHAAVAVGHLHRQAQVELVIRAVIQVGVYRHLVIQGLAAVGRDAARHIGQGHRQHQGAARSHCLEAMAVAARHLLPGEGLTVVGHGLATPIHHLAREGQPHVHHGIGVRRDGQGAGGMLIIAGLVVAGAIEAPFTHRHTGQGEGRVGPFRNADGEGARGAVVVARPLVAVDDVELERQVGGDAAALVNPLEQGHLVVKAVAGGVVERAHQFDLEHLDAHAVHVHITLEGLVARDAGIAVHQLVFDALTQGGQGRLLTDVGKRHLAHPIRARIDLEVACASQGVVAVEPTLIQAHPAARHEARRIAVPDGQGQGGRDPVSVLVREGDPERQVEGLAPLVIQLGPQAHLGGDAPVAVALHQIQLGPQHLAAIRTGPHQIPVGIQGEGHRAAVAAVLAIQALLNGGDIKFEAIGRQSICTVAHGKAHGAHHGGIPLVRLRHLGAGHGADDRIGPVADGHGQGRGDGVPVAVRQGEARLQQIIGTPLIQWLVQGEDIVALLIQRQRKDVLAVDGAADAVAADGDDHRCTAAGEPLQAGLAGIERDVDQGVGACGDIEIAGEGLGRAPVAILHQSEGDGIDLGQHAVGDVDIEGAQVALVPVKVGALYLQPQVDAVGADRLIQHAVERHLIFAIQPQGHGQNGLAARIQQGDDVAVDLIAGRLAAAGEVIQGGLACLEVQ